MNLVKVSFKINSDFRRRSSCCSGRIVCSNVRLNFEAHFMTQNLKIIFLLSGTKYCWVCCSRCWSCRTPGACCSTSSWPHLWTTGAPSPTNYHTGLCHNGETSPVLMETPVTSITGAVSSPN